jgi:uncharacterized FlgJ-related protein
MDFGTKKKFLNESRQLEVLQKLINTSMDKLKNICETQNSESNEIVSFSACDILENNSPKIILNKVDMDEKKKFIFILYVDFEYNNIHFPDEDPLIWELSYELKNWIGDNRIIVEDVINKYLGAREW